MTFKRVCGEIEMMALNLRQSAFLNIAEDEISFPEGMASGDGRHSFFVCAENSRAGAERRETLLKLREMIEQMKVTVRICKEVKAFRSFRSFQQMAEMAVNLSRQCEGWIKSEQQRQQTAGNR